MNGAYNSTFFFASPRGPWGGSKGQILLNFNKYVNFKDFYVFSGIKDIKHINRIFVLWPGSCPRGGTWGCPGGKNFLIFIEILLSIYHQLSWLLSDILGIFQ